MSKVKTFSLARAAGDYTPGGVSKFMIVHMPV